MKRTLALFAAAVIGSLGLSSAFTLDAVGYNGSELSPAPVSIFVPGYGEVIFEVAEGSCLVVGSGYQNYNSSAVPPLSFDENDAIKITTDSREPREADFDFVRPSVAGVSKPQAIQVTLKASGDAASLKPISQAGASIPEPTTVALGLLALSGFVTRRRR